MNYLSGYVWDGADSGDSVLVQQVTSRGRAALLCCVSEDGTDLEEGDTVGGYLTGQLLRWFCDRGVRLCGKDAGDNAIERELCEILEDISNEVQYFQDKKGGSSQAGITGILVLETRFWMIHRGKSRVYLLNRRFNNSHIRLLTRTENGDEITQDKIWKETAYKKEPEIIGGRLQKDLGILICTPSFCREFSEKVLAQCLNIREIRSELQIEKRLRELMETGRDPESKTGGSAVFFKVV